MRSGPPVDAGHAAPPVRVDVLGPVRLTVDGDVVEVPGPKRGLLLALLAKADGAAVAVDDIVDALWPGGAPASARGTLHSHVSRLRAHLGPAAPRLEGLDAAYRLRLDGAGSGTDAAHARSLLAAAEAVGAEDGARLLREARSLWRGPPLAGVRDAGPLAAWVVTLDQLRQAIDQAAATCALEAGAPGEAVEIAGALVASDPFAEPPVLVLMRAMAASGRAAEALRVGHEHRRRLKSEAGLDPSPALAELEREIATATVPAAGALPRPASRLRGRDADLAEVERLVADERLVTVLGPGGVGKTRLVAEVAARADDVVALQLAPVGDPAAIPAALAAALDLRVRHGGVLAACATLLGAGPTLLVVDNCEHVLDAVAEVISALLAACPHLTVLATSREPLGLPDEQQIRLVPLRSPSPEPGDLRGDPAVAVFVDRARRARPDLAFDEGHLRTIGAIVRRLDGLPLAIELAAGRLSSLDLDGLQARLDRALDLLGDGRGHTLRDTIAWSYDLLPGPERRFLRHLGVFPDGFALASAESVAAALGVPGDAASALAHLVDASMVGAEPSEPTRYRMLDTIRSFARDRLEATGERDDATELFLRWAAELTGWIGRTAAGPEEGRADAVLRRELTNLRAAWRLVRRHRRLDDAARMAVVLGETAGWRDLTEIWGWTLELADDPALDGHADAAAVLGVAAECAWGRGEVDRAERLARRGLSSGGDGAWRCHSALALVALSHGDHDEVIAHGAVAGVRANRAGPEPGPGVAALAAAYSGRFDQAATLADEMTSTDASPTGDAFRSYVAGEIAALDGRSEQAEAYYERAIARARESGASFVDGIASVGLLTLRAATGRVAGALDGYDQLLDYWERTGGWEQQWTTLRNLAELLRAIGDEDDEETAVFLDAAADAAPEAPPVGASSGHVRRPGLVTIRAQAATASRAVVLATARRAIARRRRAAAGTSVPAGRGGGPAATTR